MANPAVAIIVTLSQGAESSIMIFAIHQNMKGIITPGVAHQPSTQNFLILPPHKNSTSSTTVFQPDDNMKTVDLEGIHDDDETRLYIQGNYKTTHKAPPILIKTNNPIIFQKKLLFDIKSGTICTYWYVLRIVL